MTLNHQKVDINLVIMRRFANVLFALFGIAVSTVTNAELNCDVDLQHGIVVSNNQIRVLEQSRTVYQINNMGQLFIAGKLIKLEPAQQRQLREFAAGLHYVVPKMIVMATEGVELAVLTIDQVYMGLVGKDHATYEKLNVAMHRVQKRVREKFIHASHNYYIGPGSLENVDELVDKELEEQIERAFNTSVGGILSAIAGLQSTGDEGYERHVENLTQRLEVMEEQIELQVVPKANSLRKKAQWFCKKFEALDKVEERLRSQVPGLQGFNVIVSGAKARESSH